MKKNKKLSHGKKKTTSHRMHVIMPKEVVVALRHYAFDEGCSVSWILTELAMEHLGMDEDDLAGESPPKYFKDRVGDWTKNKKNSGKNGEGTKGEEETREMLEFHCASCGVHVRTWKHSPSKEAQDIIKSGLCMKCYSTA